AVNYPFVEINGQQVMVRPDNTFAGEIELPKPGQNKIVVTGRDASGSTQQISIVVVKLITFPDIQTHWAKREIEFLATLGYVKGSNEAGLFLPDQTIQRSEMASLIVLAKSFPVGSYQQSSFRDIMENHWAINYIETGYKFGLLKGYPDHWFRPNSYLNRAEASAVIVRFSDIPLLAPDQPPALDVSVGHWAAKDIYTFQRNGLMPALWKGQNRFYPQVPISRAEFVAALARTPQMNRAIAQLINRNPEFEVIVDNYGQQKVVDQDSLAKQRDLLENRARDEKTYDQYSQQGHFVQAKVTPEEVRPGTSLFITAVGWRKLSQVIATVPNDEVVALKYNPETDRFEGYWKIPNIDHIYGNYTIKIKAIDTKQEVYRTESNKFAIVAIPEMMVPQEAELEEKSGVIEIPGSAGIVFVEYAAGGELDRTTISSIQKAPIKEAAPIKTNTVELNAVVTRAEFAEFLVDIAKIRKSSRIKFVANDIPINHPNAAAINACLVRGYMKLDDQKRFKPEDPVSRAFVSVALTRALKITVPNKLAQNPFADVSKSYWAAGQIYTVTKLGWMQPLAKNKFEPATNLNVSMLNDIKQRIKK
ncbi:MAG: S-layer homology domain-containing protein, partial [Candidatus Margulisbacteria bacterium]|nr:S-layer homology domain-containing protein [Candidatus Margulisiibacteriota bacterium]